VGLTCPNLATARRTSRCRDPPTGQSDIINRRLQSCINITVSIMTLTAAVAVTYGRVALWADLDSSSSGFCVPGDAVISTALCRTPRHTTIASLLCPPRWRRRHCNSQRSAPTDYCLVARNSLVRLSCQSALPSDLLEHWWRSSRRLSHPLQGRCS
jgi:hypothetical protein